MIKCTIWLLGILNLVLNLVRMCVDLQLMNTWTAQLHAARGILVGRGWLGLRQASRVRNPLWCQNAKTAKLRFKTRNLSGEELSLVDLEFYRVGKRMGKRGNLPWDSHSAICYRKQRACSVRMFESSGHGAHVPWDSAIYYRKHAGMLGTNCPCPLGMLLHQDLEKRLEKS